MHASPSIHGSGNGEPAAACRPMMPHRHRTGTHAMDFRIAGLDPHRFADLRGLDDDALARRNARRCIADARPGFPDRIALTDAEPGETLLLVHHVHHDVANPY